MEGLVRARSMLGFAECVQSLGGDPHAIFSMAGISPKIMDDPQGWIPFGACVTAYEMASRALKEPAFGVKHANSRDLSYLGPLVVYARHASNLREAVEDFRRYFFIHNTGYRSVMETKAGVSTLTYHMPEGLRAGAAQWVEGTICSTQRMLKHIMGEPIQVKHVLLRHEPQRPLRDYEEFYQAPVLFGQAGDGVALFDVDLERPVPHHDEMIHAFMARYLEDRVSHVDEDIVAATRALLETLIPAAQGKLEIVAEHLRIHPRTLQRRLHEVGSSFSELLDDQRRTMAVRLLSEGNLPLVNIAFFLGYAEQSAFNHAFERWYGIAPSKWLKRSR